MPRGKDEPWKFDNDDAEFSRTRVVDVVIDVLIQG